MDSSNPYGSPVQYDERVPEPGNRLHLNLFDKFCAGLAVLLALIFGVLGAVGLFAGCRFNFTLPPVLGVLPALVGWGIIKAVRVAWSVR